ncbi:transglycosylase domain-containing protein [Sphingomonas sp.]|uniref:transglycosylase domain-containing protein n=1 Tax=Sphingomonas sp. TaxID=28214 RepID=UPI003CC568BD
MKYALRGGSVILAAILLLIAYEAVQVLRARANTPAILAAHADRSVRIADLPPRRIAMLLRVEDPAFLHHHGIDWSTPGAGATTITQGLVKRLYFDRFDPGFAKIEQSLIAWLVLDPAVGKREQVDLLLNYAWMGNQGRRPVIGFPAAALVYFGKPLARLDDRQFLGLVAMLMAPRDLDPLRHTAANAERVRRIEALLAGRCTPRDHGDVKLVGCAGISI